MRRSSTTLIAVAGAFLVAGSACSFSGAGVEPEDDVDAAPGTDAGGDAAVADEDSDQIPDDRDNCVSEPNPDQADEDTDGLGDACDNCPHVSNPDQADVMETGQGGVADGVGDVCDPNPADEGDMLAVFLPFNDPSEIATWQVAGSQSFAIEDGLLKQTDNTDLGLIWHNDLGLPDATWVTKLTYRNISTTDRFRGVAVIGRFDRDGNFGNGLGCGEMLDTGFSSTPFYMTTSWGGGGFSQGTHGSTTLTNDQVATYSAHNTGSTQVDCHRFETGNDWSRSTGNENGTGVALATWSTGADFEYLVGYSVIP